MNKERIVLLLVLGFALGWVTHLYSKGQDCQKRGGALVASISPYGTVCVQVHP